MTRKYGREFQTDSLLSVEYFAFREGLTPETGGLGRHKHFENIVSETWPDFIWYKEAHEQAEALCNNKFTGFTAGASFSKSDLLAKYALTSWFANPIDTLVIVCSTTSVDAKQRIWGELVRDFRKARSFGKAVGRIIESQSIIKLGPDDGNLASSDNASICLVAAGSDSKDDALKRLQGRKNKRVILILDELQDCSEEIIKTALWNLNANDHFEVHAAGNASSRYDAHGTFMAPVDGWNSINRTTHRWKIKVGGKEGVGMHFDATLDTSPNMLRFAQGVAQLPFLRKAEDIMAAKTGLGENNAVYMRQFVGFWPDSEGESNYIITDAALSAHDAYDKAEWRTTPTELAGIDPSYSNGGDRFIFHHCRWGMSTQGVWTFEFYESIQIKPIPIPGEERDYANIRVCKQIAEERGISPRMIGMDASAGSSLLSIAHQHWSVDILGVSFGGSPSDLPISLFDKRIASDVYANATSELAYVLVEFLNSGQVRGVKPDHANELTKRKYEIVAGGKILIEKKDKVKKRLGFSPDIADSGAVCLRVLRERLKIQAGSDAGSGQGAGGDWRALQRRRDVSTLSSRGASTQASLPDQVMDSVAMRERALKRLQGLTQRKF
jgi:hypothetical protein